MVKKIIVSVCRIFISTLFIFSGFVKLVDPTGSAYKFEEYFSPDVLNLEFLVPYSLSFSIVLILIEILLGLMLLIGYFPKKTLWGLFLITFFFLFLTWYSAYYNKVTDCGCFGDAIKMSPWQTFYKNVVFIVLIVVMFIYQKVIKPILPRKIAHIFMAFSLVVFSFLMYYSLAHLPLIDFRPYAVGKNIPEGMAFIDGKEPPIHDFYLESPDGEELTENILESEKMMLAIVYNFEDSNTEGLNHLKKTSDKALEKGYQFYMLSASTQEDFEALKTKHQWNFEMLFCDETVLKTIIRANPGYVTLKKGTVIGKWNWVDGDYIEL